MNILAYLFLFLVPAAEAKEPDCALLESKPEIASIIITVEPDMPNVTCYFDMDSLPLGGQGIITVTTGSNAVSNDNKMRVTFKFSPPWLTTGSLRR